MTKSILNGQALKSFHLRLTGSVKLLSEIPYNIVLEVLTKEIRQEKNVKGIRVGKEEIKLSLLAVIIIRRQSKSN